MNSLIEITVLGTYFDRNSNRIKSFIQQRIILKKINEVNEVHYDESCI